MTEAPKCARCAGWGFEPDKSPLTHCPACNGTGKPAKQRELIDG